MSRAERLQQRFEFIKQSLAELHGERAAFCAAVAAYLMAGQSAANISMKQLRVYVSDAVAQAAFDEDMARYDAELERILQGVHKTICEELNVDQQFAFGLARMFREVINDVLNQRG